MNKKIHHIALVYQDNSDCNFWLQHHRYTYRNATKVVCEYEEDEFHYYPCRIEKIKDKFCGMQLNAVEFLYGKYHSDDINFIMSRVRL